MEKCNLFIQLLFVELELARIGAKEKKRETFCQNYYYKTEQVWHIWHSFLYWFDFLVRHCWVFGSLKVFVDTNLLVTSLLDDTQWFPETTIVQEEIFYKISVSHNYTGAKKYWHPYLINTIEMRSLWTEMKYLKNAARLSNRVWVN